MGGEVLKASKSVDSPAGEEVHRDDAVDRDVEHAEREDDQGAGQRTDHRRRDALHLMSCTR